MKSKSRKRSLFDDHAFNIPTSTIDDWGWEIEQIISEDAHKLLDGYPEINEKEIRADLFYWLRLVFTDWQQTDRAKQYIVFFNNWFDFHSATKLGYELNSITLNLKKGKSTEKINIDLSTDFLIASKISKVINAAYKKTIPMLGIKKLVKLPSLRVDGIKQLSKGSKTSISRATKLKKQLGTKERVYKYFYDVISRVAELLKSDSYSLFGNVDIDKMLRNHLGKF